MREQYLETLRSLGFQRIANRIQLIWGTRELVDYFEELLLNDRNDRQGFSHGAFEAIFKLSDLHNSIFTEFSPKSETWSRK